MSVGRLSAVRIVSGQNWERQNSPFLRFKRRRACTADRFSPLGCAVFSRRLRRAVERTKSRRGGLELRRLVHPDSGQNLDIAGRQLCADFVAEVR